jgi:hypothetical protein
MVDIWSTEDTLREAPGEESTRGDVAGDVEPGVREQMAPPRGVDVLPHDEAPRERRQQADQEKQQPPPARAQ